MAEPIFLGMYPSEIALKPVFAYSLRYRQVVSPLRWLRVSTCLSKGQIGAEQYSNFGQLELSIRYPSPKMRIARFYVPQLIAGRSVNFRCGDFTFRFPSPPGASVYPVSIRHVGCSGVFFFGFIDHLITSVMI